jgi:hypothetical protein
MADICPPFYSEHKDFFVKKAIKALEEALKEDISDIVKEKLEIALEANKELRDI